ncbi:C39 family peptidase [Paenibacillus donghaensis]|uniref:Peptidase C39-like domain-containing protein n=1 Tax=Paenibacillus donghaensis TaxID=414771 RepID=A0A2Z2KNR5_9BACL|nr:C39 family peptidase [Paenibacillus donghaensis]ASA25263.1 hypothetical protein B9T62_33750 [Paenibacillus donghaensis]
MTANRTRGNKLDVKPYTQWEPGVTSPASACGPATLAALTEYWHTGRGRTYIRGLSHYSSQAAHINALYSHHGGRPWGMSVRGFIRGLKSYLATKSAGTRVAKPVISVFNNLPRYMEEIDSLRPVAIKFDKWSGLRWRGNFAYDYHWVLGVGYEEREDHSGTVLIVQDNGIRHKNGTYTPGRERRIPYAPNRRIITMIACLMVD